MSAETIFSTIVTVFVSGLAGFLLAGLRKVSPQQLADFEERAVTPICERLEKVEAKLETFCTRAELRDTVQRIEKSIETNRSDNREHFNSIFSRLDGLKRTQSR